MRIHIMQYFQYADHKPGDLVWFNRYRAYNKMCFIDTEGRLTSVPDNVGLFVGVDAPSASENEQNPAGRTDTCCWFLIKDKLYLALIDYEHLNLICEKVY